MPEEIHFMDSFFFSLPGGGGGCSVPGDTFYGFGFFSLHGGGGGRGSSL